MVNKGHLTDDGLDQIQIIKSGMNKQRLVDISLAKDSLY
jgi:hypothetical protein